MKNGLKKVSTQIWNPLKKALKRIGSAPQAHDEDLDDSAGCQYLTLSFDSLTFFWDQTCFPALLRPF